MDSFLFEIQDFQWEKPFIYRQIGSECDSYEEYFIEHFNNGHCIVTGSGKYVSNVYSYESKILGGTTEASPNNFSIFNGDNYFPRIIGWTNLQTQIFYALTSNIAVLSGVYFIDKKNQNTAFLIFNVVNDSFISYLKTS